VSPFPAGPYAFCAVWPPSTSEATGSAAAAGLIDTAGYLGGVLSGRGVVSIAKNLGWESAFLALAGVAALTVIAAVVYWVLDELRSRPTPVAHQVQT
jgi:OPA family glycerol-3-phosphate transporter-like MFS transporter